MYKYPINKQYNYVIKHHPLPFGELHIDDIIDSKGKKRNKQYEKLLLIPTPKQRSVEWFEARKSRISASDSGAVLGCNPHVPPYKFVLNKSLDIPFPPNINCYFGTMMEYIATMIYEFRTGVRVKEFGTIPHEKYTFLSASPDGIVSPYKTDGKTKTSFVGTMLEIKCVTTREIKFEGKLNGDICPSYYYCQMQTQMNCCNLDTCHFWQCKILEYNNRQEFIDDTLDEEPFRSKETKMEKGCLIQLLPKDKMNDILNGDYENVLYSMAQHIYPPSIIMTPYDCDIWIAETLANLDEVIKTKMDKFNNPSTNGYYLNKVIYWKTCVTNCVTVPKEDGWIEKSLPIFEKIWNCVTYFRNNKDKAELFNKYIESLPDYHSFEKGLKWNQIKERNANNEKQVNNVMELMYNICNEPDKTDIAKYKEYKKMIKNLKTI
jgi:putative phage-type endonuclease